MTLFSSNVQNQIAGAISFASSRRTSEKDGSMAQSFIVFDWERRLVW
jgi:hypothetical protein